MSNPNPLGPISQGDNVCLCTVYNNQVFVYVNKTVTDNMGNRFDADTFVPLYIQEPTGGTYFVNSDVTNLSIITMKISGNSSSPSLQVVSPAELSGKQVNVVTNTRLNRKLFGVIDPTKNAPFAEQVNFRSSYQTPPSPGIVFSAVAYTIDNINVANTFYINDNVGFIYERSDIYFLPVSFFLDSSPQAEQKVCQQQTNNPLLAVRLFACSLCPSVIGCATCTQDTNQRAWTRAVDCQNNFVYQYCGVGQYCSSCYGMCQATKSSQCLYTPVNNGSFYCTASDAPVIPVVPGLPIAVNPVTPWYRQTWVIILFLVIIVVVLILVGYRYYERRKLGKNTTTSITSTQTTT